MDCAGVLHAVQALASLSHVTLDARAAAARCGGIGAWVQLVLSRPGFRLEER